MYYLDTSYLVKLYVREPGSDRVAKWMAGKSGFACSLHGRLELIAALKRQQREAKPDPSRWDKALSLFEKEEQKGYYTWLPVTDDLIRSACAKVRCLDQKIFIRSGDALHLACAAEAGFKEIYSHDRHMLGAAAHFGLKGTDIIPNP